MDVYEMLSEQGPFAKLLPGFSPRAGQQALAQAIGEAINDKRMLIAEAGTGTGKTFAYLVPAIESGKKVLISTGTRHLQDQLFHRDLPLVLQALEYRMPVALLKGRANYLCLHRMKLAEEHAFLTRESRSDLQTIKFWGKKTQRGDIAELGAIEEDARIWPLVTSTTENCLGSECPDWDDCFVVKARRDAQEADIVVVNHHLLLADMALKEEGFGELLPTAEVFVIDEAHQLPDVASRFFGRSISSRQINLLLADAIAEQLQDAPEYSEIRDCTDQVKTALKRFRLALGVDNQKDAWNKIMHKPALVEARDELQQTLASLQQHLQVIAEKSKGLEQCLSRCEQLLLAVKTYGEFSEESPSIFWYETYTSGFVLNATPLDVDRLFASQQQSLSSCWIFTSATLQVGNDFKHFAIRLGLQDYASGNWESPFDYARQSLLYLPRDLPETNSPQFNTQLVEHVIPILEASGGRAFLLFTSYRAMYEAEGLLKGWLEYPLLVQGSQPKHELLRQFKEEGNAVLLGTGSFWEGVDVRGEALSCVVIDKLPFASPGDPVMQARLDAIRGNGGNPFMDYQLPQAVISLKQGAGRLIRDVTDIGVLVIGDTRLKTKQYGKLFIQSLPPMPITHDIQQVKQFFYTNAPHENTGT